MDLTLVRPLADGIDKKGMLAMTLRKAWNLAVVATALATLHTSGCSRDHIEAINLANEADRNVKVNVEGAIQKYEQARQLDPSNHRILHKLASAYEKKEDWEKMASILAAAMQQAPEFANYAYKRGYALIKLAEAGDKDKYEEAKAPLQQCVQTDPNLAECYFLLGQAFEWTDDPQNALQNYTAAIEHDPTRAFFYPSPAALYYTYKLFSEAEAILTEGTRIIPPTEETSDSLYEMYILLFQVAQAKGDEAGMVASMEKANEVAGEAHPEIAFNLGSTYAVQNPPKKEKAVRMLNSFTKRACRSQQAQKFREQCETAQTLIQKLGGAG